MNKATPVLATATVELIQYDMPPVRMRCLIDSGAQVNLLTLDSVKEFDLDIQLQASFISGIGGLQETVGTVTADLYAKNGTLLVKATDFIVVAQILNALPSKILRCSASATSFAKELADTEYHKPGVINALLGVGMCARILNHDKVQLADGLVALKSELGWIVMGECIGETAVTCPVSHQVQEDKNDSLNSALKRLWEQDQVVLQVPDMTPDEVWCEENFKDSCYKDADGRYVTSLSIKQQNLNLGQSYDQALRRFRNLEKRLQGDGDLAMKYIAFMREYIALGHMKQATKLKSKSCHYYIPHHPVLKKFRVVFDASAKTTNGRSLNDIQLPGPKIQPDLYDIVLRFRTGKIALTADVVKMFRQVRVRQQDWDLQRILWRESPTQEIQEYWLTVITYGLTSAGYNAVKAMNKCAQDNAITYPIAAKIVSESFYMDDMLCSTHTLEEAREVFQQVKASLGLGGFELAKWSSNSLEINKEAMEQTLIRIEDGQCVSVLGLHWEPATDQLMFKVNLTATYENLTKRIIASEGTKVFDPNGYISPITIHAKIFLQNLWRIGVEWDEPLPNDVSSEWTKYYNNLKDIAELRVPRWTGTFRDDSIQLHVFCDASAKAYGAVLYVRAQNANQEVTVNLLTSKSKVAGLQVVSIPRLELCAAKLAADLMQRVCAILGTSMTSAHYWTDSEIVLHWIRKFPSELKVFVGNRVSAIQANSTIGNWRHVKSQENPADLVSRGVTAKELINSELWWNGPSMLKAQKSRWVEWKRKDPPARDIKSIELETRKGARAVMMLATRATAVIEEICLLERFNKLSQIIRTTAYVMRFIRNCKRILGARANHRTDSPAIQRLPPNHSHACNSGLNTQLNTAPCTLTNDGFAVNARISSMISSSRPITVDEYKDGLIYWIKYTQELYFSRERQQIQKNLPLPNASRLLKFTPFIEEQEGVMRMRGRLDRASLTYDQRHPILLPGESTLVRRMIAEAHIKTLHGGNQLTMQYLRDKYWIIGLRSAVRKQIHNCVICAIQRRKMSTQLMADLPKDRVTISRPFNCCGVDYAGPLQLKPYKSYRGTVTQLIAYVAVFVCFATKAVHLELVGDLTSQAFLGAMDRMILRRGHIERLYSDRGRNFIGAANELRKIYDLWQSTEIVNELTVRGISWTFNTPLAPHHGGLWEAAVKSFKYHLNRTVGQIRLTFEEMNTILVRIEACMNSRPLVAPTDDPMDLTVITPGHLLTGRQIIGPLGPPTQSLPNDNISWHKIRKMEEDFWSRWSLEYLSELQRRYKWTTVERCIQENDLVVIQNDNMPPGQWQRGRVVRVFPGKDGLIRSAIVRTPSGEYERPITRLCVLPVDPEVKECLAQ